MSVPSSNQLSRRPDTQRTLLAPFGSPIVWPDLSLDLVEKLEIEVVVIDPAYLAYSGAGDRVSNMFAMGEALMPLVDMIRTHGITPIMLHHSRQLRVDHYAPLTLEELAFAGWQQFARSWILLSRREPYEQTGQHRLWFSILQSGDPAKMNAALKQIVIHIRLHFEERTESRKRYRGYKLVGGEIKLCTCAQPTPRSRRTCRDAPPGNTQTKRWSGNFPYLQFRRQSTNRAPATTEGAN